MVQSTRDLRKALLAAMPREAFEPQPQRGYAGFVLAAVMLAAAYAIARFDLPWWANLVLSLGLGQGIASLGFLGHEAMHRSVFKAKWARTIVAWMGLAPLLISPGVWSAWHMQAHHAHTNDPDLDPDVLFDVESFTRSWIARWRTRMFPGSRHVLSFIAYSWLFTFQSHLFLWFASEQPRLKKLVTLNRTKERIFSVLMIGGWLALAFALGLRTAWWVQILPLMTANFTVLLYAGAQHWLRPRLTHDDPVLTTVSVSVPRIFDWMHLQFSHHQEHHFFPGMSHKFAPLLRQKLREIAPEAVAVVPMWTALKALFSTPANYIDDFTLAHPDRSGQVDLAELAIKLRLPPVPAREGLVERA